MAKQAPGKARKDVVCYKPEGKAKLYSKAGPWGSPEELILL